MYRDFFGSSLFCEPIFYRSGEVLSLPQPQSADPRTPRTAAGLEGNELSQSDQSRFCANLWYILAVYCHISIKEF